jgi:hypothetical protein
VVSGGGAYIDDGVVLRAVDGPAYVGQEWAIATRYDHAIENILPTVAPSPRIGWRSVDDASVAQVAFEKSSGDSLELNDSIALFLTGINWRTGFLQGYDGVSWSNLVSLDAATRRTALPYERFGNTIRPSATVHVAEHYIRFGELIGATVDLGGGFRRRVTWNTEGYWTNATGKAPVLQLDGITGAEPASGTCDLWSTRLLCVLHMLDAKYRGLRVVVSIQETVDDYFTIGQLLLGPVIAFGWPYSWGRVQSSEPNTDLYTADDGSRQAFELGPVRRWVEFAWTDPVDMMAASGDDPDDDYLLNSASVGGRPIAAKYDAPMLIAGLVEALRGSLVPVVYIPRMQKGPLNSRQYVGVDRSLYGRITTSVQIEGVQGEEVQDEVARVSAIRIEEEV